MKTTLKIINRLYSYIKKYRALFFLSLTLSFAGTAISAIMPLLIADIIDYISSNVQYINGQVQSTIISSVISNRIFRLAVIVLGSQILNFFSYISMATVIQNTVRDIRTSVSEKMQRLPVSYFDGQLQGDILSRITNDIDNIGNSFQQGIIPLFAAFLTIIAVIIVLATISIPILIVVGLIIPASIIISRLFVGKSQKYFENLQIQLGQLNGFVQEDYSAFDVVKLYGQEEKSQERFENIIQDIQKNGFKGGLLSAMIMPMSELIGVLAYIAITIIGSSFVLAGRLTIGILSACCQYVWQIVQPISQITQLIPMAQACVAASRRVFEILDEQEEPQEIEKIALPTNLTGKVQFKNISFGYKETKQQIRNLSFTAKAGQMIAIVGPTGAGKTTLINLLLRFYEINSGDILIDDISIKDLTKQQLRSIFGMVLQDAWLYQSTIADNIRFGNLAASIEEIEQAAQTANIAPFIEKLPDGYNTILNEETTNISQGQKQLLTIARAIIANPKILILDEATSSVDTRLELLIQKAMQKILKNRTSFVIAHRLSTVREADLILVLKDGEIVEQGTHEVLLKRKGFYEQIYNSQFADAE
jgi:ABC-type multidrug transport system, ATPase and permease components